MSLGKFYVTEADLEDYLAGRLDRHRRAVVSGAVARDPELSMKLVGYQAQADLLHAQYDNVLDEPIPERLIRVLEQPTGSEKRTAGRARRRLDAIAAAVVFLIVGAGLGWWLGQGANGQNDLVQAMISQALQAHETWQPGTSDTALFGGDLSESFASLEVPFEAPVRWASLEDLNYAPIGFHAFGDEGSEAAQLVYHNKDKDKGRVSLYVRPRGETLDLPFHRLQEGDYSIVYWNDGPLTYVLVGNAGDADLGEISRQIYGAQAFLHAQQQQE